MTSTAVIRLDSKRCILEGDGKLHKIKPVAEKGPNGGDGGEPVAARDYVLCDIPLSEKQFEAIVGERAAAALFNSSANTPMEPAFGSFDTIKLKNRTYKNCGITFHLEETADNDIEIKSGARIKLISVQLTGGNPRACALLRSHVTAVFPRKLSTLDMEERLGGEIKVSMRLGSLEEADAEDAKSKQGDLVKKAQDAEDADREKAASRKNGGDQPAATN
jgi:hypothetical protein